MDETHPLYIANSPYFDKNKMLDSFERYNIGKYIPSNIIGIMLISKDRDLSSSNINNDIILPKVMYENNIIFKYLPKIITSYLSINNIASSIYSFDIQKDIYDITYKIYLYTKSYNIILNLTKEDINDMIKYGYDLMEHYLSKK